MFNARPRPQASCQVEQSREVESPQNYTGTAVAVMRGLCEMELDENRL